MRFAVWLCALSLASCAGYTVTPTELADKWTSNPEGYVVYEPKPFLKLSVTQTDKGPVFASEVVYLPNLARPYRLNTWNFLAKNDITFGLTNGWMLTNVSSKTDTTDIAKMVGEAAKGALNEAFRKDAPAYVALFYELKVAGDGIGIGNSPAFTLPPLTSEQEEKMGLK